LAAHRIKMSDVILLLENPIVQIVIVLWIALIVYIALSDEKDK
jgi:hypothetical protein